MLLTLAVALPTPHDYSGTPFKEGTVPGLQPQGGFLTEQEGFCTLQHSLERTLSGSTYSSTYLNSTYTIYQEVDIGLAAAQ